MEQKMIEISVPYGNREIRASIPESSLVFEGKMGDFAPLEHFEEALRKRLESPIGCRPLKEQVSKGKKVLILIEDNTRNTPVKRILPVLIDYLKEVGLNTRDIEILTAPGTHRIMTESEVIEKVGKEVYDTVKIYQHDFTDKESIMDLGVVKIGGMEFPVQVNKKVQEADFIIGLGNIIPHSDAGFSGGAKIVQPGICGGATTAATHIAGALMDDIPLGVIEDNPCRMGIEQVGKIAGLKFIINVVMTKEGEIVDIFAGDFIAAHREGAKLSAKVYGVKIPELADIVVVSSHPCDIDYWQAEKGLVSAYFSVKKGGIIIFAAPCYEGMEHNHPKLRDWCRLTHKEAKEKVLKISLDDAHEDLVAADIAMANARVREKADILIVTDGLPHEDIDILGYKKFDSLKDALDFALGKIPGGTVGVLPRGGDCLPYLIKQE